MKKVLIALLLLSFTVLGQDKPLSQTEYRNMLYDLQRNKVTKAEIVEALRKRGIDFEVTDGMRSLTRSKGANDEELKSAFEEAGRRHANPEAARLPLTPEADAVLAKAREATAAALDEMPDFVVKQVISRSAAFAGTGNWRPQDTVVIAVSYSTEKGEQYQVLAMNGAPVQSTKSGSYANMEGSTTGGEFVEALEKLFKPASKTTFTLVTTDVIRNQPALVFDYEINIENNKDGGVGFKDPNSSGGFSFTTVPAGEKGRVWIDRKNGRVLRISFDATDIPKDFRVRAYTSTIDYDWVDIAGERVLLPITSDNRFTSAEGRQLFQSRNYIRFRNYQKYGSEVRILDDDVKPEPEPSPTPKP
ncbi:MAG TPA: hypothetical protein VGO43_15095 [Pyrinomonadaceae bacterium]|jgi:hypothetical protein|nr:hypothetical protein [Pyrinomonadaceae bacterium]